MSSKGSMGFSTLKPSSIFCYRELGVPDTCEAWLTTLETPQTTLLTDGKPPDTPTFI